MDLEKLNDFLNKSKLPKAAIAKELGISRNSFYKRLSGDIVFSNSELNRLAILLRMTANEILDIFFSDWVDKNAH